MLLFIVSRSLPSSHINALHRDICLQKFPLFPFTHIMQLQILSRCSALTRLSINMRLLLLLITPPIFMLNHFSHIKKQQKIFNKSLNDKFSHQHVILFVCKSSWHWKFHSTMDLLRFFLMMSCFCFHKLSWFSTPPYGSRWIINLVGRFLRLEGKKICRTL